MPGKVNPTQCEAMTMVCAQVMGNDMSIAFAGSQGNFELNVFKPVIIHNLLQSIRLLATLPELHRHCVAGIEAEPKAHDGAARALAHAGDRARAEIGYDKAAKIAKPAHKNGTTLREEALALAYISEDDFNALMKPELMIKPGA